MPDDERAAPERPAPKRSAPETRTETALGDEVSLAEAADTDQPPDEAAQAPEPTSVVRRHRGLVRVTHWLHTVVLAGMIGSGLQIYGAFPHFGIRGKPYLPNPLDGRAVAEPFRLGGWLAGGLNWHFALAWPFVLTGLVYVAFLILSGEWRPLLFRPRDIPRAWKMQLYYLRLRREHPPQGKHNALQKAAYSLIILLGGLSAATGFAIYKPVQLAWLVRLLGGFELARYWHFWAVWLFIGFTIVHVIMVLLVDPGSLRAMITGRYRGRFPDHD